jgi:hypothetical protein
MRKSLLLAGLTLGLAGAGAAHAQFPMSALGLNRTINVMPSITNNSPMSYVNPNAPIGGSMYRPSNYKLSQLFYTPTRTNTISNTIVRGQSSFPTPAQMQAAAPSYFLPFQMYRAPCIRP